MSRTVTANQVVFSLILFTIVYIVLFALFLFLLNKKIVHGPVDYGTMEPIEEGARPGQSADAKLTGGQLAEGPTWTSLAPKARITK